MSEPCERCGATLEQGHRCSGWSTQTCLVALRHHRSQVQRIVDEVELGAPIARKDGTRTMRDGWISVDGEDWHVGLEELADAADDGRTTVFRAMAEQEDRRVRVRLSPQMVDALRRRVCPEAPGKSQ